MYIWQQLQPPLKRGQIDYKSELHAEKLFINMSHMQSHKISLSERDLMESCCVNWHTHTHTMEHKIPSTTNPNEMKTAHKWMNSLNVSNFVLLSR